MVSLNLYSSYDDARTTTQWGIMNRREFLAVGAGLLATPVWSPVLDQKARTANSFDSARHWRRAATSCRQSRFRAGYPRQRFRVRNRLRRWRKSTTHRCRCAANATASHPHYA